MEGFQAKPLTKDDEKALETKKSFELATDSAMMLVNAAAKNMSKDEKKEEVVSPE